MKLHRLSPLPPPWDGHLALLSELAAPLTLAKGPTEQDPALLSCGSENMVELITRLPRPPSGLISCILVFRNEETAMWEGDEATEAGDTKGQELESANLKPIHTESGQQLSEIHLPCARPPACARSLELGEGARAAPRVILPTHRYKIGAVSSEAAGKHLPGTLKKPIPPKPNEPNSSNPPRKRECKTAARGAA